jgi:tetratricopeptide (TPR) repeat protein
MIAVVFALSLLTADQDAVNTARDLYASAAYEDALSVLNRVPEASRPPEEARTIAQYRAFCLLALGRTSEAERAIEAVISREPTYRPAANDVSPRVRAAFAEVRRRMLPSIIQQKYGQAKEAFDKKDYEKAAAGFAQVLEVMNDPDAPSAQLTDLRTLAGGFRDLAARAAAPPPPPPVAPVPVAAPAPPTPPAPPRIYTAADGDVVPPTIVRQELPPFPGQLPMQRSGAIEVTINQDGIVEFAVMRQTVSTAYDNLAIAAAKTWRYKPAMVNGAPVKFKKVIQVTVKPNK